jgi:hypothetical protein
MVLLAFMSPINSSILDICITIKSLDVLALATAAVVSVPAVLGLTVPGSTPRNAEE